MENISPIILFNFLRKRMREIFEAKKDTRLPIFTQRILANLAFEEKWKRQPAPLWIEFHIKLWLGMYVYFQFLFAFVYSVVSLVVPKLEGEILTSLLMKFFKRGGWLLVYSHPPMWPYLTFECFGGTCDLSVQGLRVFWKKFINSGVKIASSILGTTSLTTL